jgi:hypothetical protein
MVVAGYRSWLPALSLLIAAGAATLGVIAIVSDDVGPTSTPPAVGAVANGEPSVVRAAVVGEPCGLRIRGNLPC